MITDAQFKEYIDRISDSYEKIKDSVYMSKLDITGPDAQSILNEVANLRTIACTALRESHINTNFKDN